MFKKKIVVFVFLAIVANHTIFSQTVRIDTALSNATKEISGSVPKGTKIAVLNISSDYPKLSNYIIDELIANLVNTQLFQVVPRSTVELELARDELNFQYTGEVSDESQRSLGKFLGAGTIISGSVTRYSTNSYRIVINAIDLESFTYQITYRISILSDNQVRALIASSGGFYEDYTIGQRFGMGALNIFGGTGSIINGHRIGWVTAGFEAVGVLLITFGFVAEGELYWNSEYVNTVMYAGLGSIGIGVVFGFIVPFFHHKPNNTSITQNNFPFNLEPVLANNQNINGFRISYNMKF